jgi:hypothetical protein
LYVCRNAGYVVTVAPQTGIHDFAVCSLRVIARDVTPSFGTALDRLNYPAQRIVGVVAELKQFGTLAASGRGARMLSWRNEGSILIP